MRNLTRYFEAAFAAAATLLCMAGVAAIVYIGGAEHLGGILYNCLSVSFCWYAFIKLLRRENALRKNNI